MIVGLNVKNAGANAANALPVRFGRIHRQKKLLRLTITCCEPCFYVYATGVRSLHELALLSSIIGANCAKIRLEEMVHAGCVGCAPAAQSGNGPPLKPFIKGGPQRLLAAYIFDSRPCPRASLRLTGH